MLYSTEMVDNQRLAMDGVTKTFSGDSTGSTGELRRAPGSMTLHRAEGGNLPVRGRCSRGLARPDSARRTRECTPPCPSRRAYCPREPLPSASLSTHATAHGFIEAMWPQRLAASRRCGRSSHAPPPCRWFGVASNISRVRCKDQTHCMSAVSAHTHSQPLSDAWQRRTRHFFGSS